MKKHIVFDFDDTISNSSPHNQQIFVNTFRKFGYKGNDEVLRHIHYSHKGGSMITQFELALKELGMKGNPEEMFRYNQDVLHPANLRKMTIFPGFEKFLERLAKNGRVVSILTNRPKSHLDIILKKHKLDGYFANVTSCFDEGYEKPDPKCFRDLMKKYKFKKSEYIYFGDSKTDAEFATNAGVDYLVIDHYLNKEKFYENIISFLLT